VDKLGEDLIPIDHFASLRLFEPKVDLPADLLAPHFEALDCIGVSLHENSEPLADNLGRSLVAPSLDLLLDVADLFRGERDFQARRMAPMAKFVHLWPTIGASLGWT